MHVAQRHPGIQGGGDERVSERVRADVLGDPGPARDPADDPPGAVAVQPLPVKAQSQALRREPFRIADYVLII